MDVKEAVGTARAYVIDLFSDEQITDVGLEEVRLDHDADAWRITVGFSRPWDLENNPAEKPKGRSYKVVAIDDKTGRVESLPAF